MKAVIHQITWNDQVYFKVYAENLNGRMILVTKTKFNTLKEAKDLVKVMLPSYTLAKEVREVKF